MVWFIGAVFSVVILSELVANYLLCKWYKAGSWQRNSRLFFKRNKLSNATPLRLRVFYGLKKHFFAYDPVLGHRMKANVGPYRFQTLFPDIPATIAQLDFFEIYTDAYGYICNNQGQERNYAALAHDNSIYKIIVSGPSTVAGGGASCSQANWPAQLENRLKSCWASLETGYKDVCVINSAVLGYKISQEIKRFEEETAYLNPHLVISYGGITEQTDYLGNPVDYARSPDQMKMAEFLQGNYIEPSPIMPNLHTLIWHYFSRSNEPKSDFYPYQNSQYLSFSAPELFVSKVKQFNALCQAHNADFLYLLRPTMGIGAKKLSEREEQLLPYFESFFFGVPWQQYVESMNRFYDEVRSQLTSLRCFHDCSHMFDDMHETVYMDPRHFNDLGHAVIAEYVFQRIMVHMGLEQSEAARQPYRHFAPSFYKVS